MKWLVVDVIWKVASAVLIGWLGGWLMGYLTFRLAKRAGLPEPRDGFVALGITFLAYGSTELIHGYGFLAVFISALAFRSVERRHRYHKNLHDFAEQIERLLMMALMVCFGAAIAEGSIFAGLNWRVVATAALVLFLVRPLSCWVSLAGYPAPAMEKGVIAFFGIRGLGSFYYLAYATGQATFESTDIIWVAVFFIVLTSIVTHGVLVTPTMQRLDNSRRSPREPERRGLISRDA